MKVRELIASSVLTEASGRTASAAPRVTVILPTFRRGDSGLLGRAIDSILLQSLTELELIIVDDASTDSTADVIAAAMARDSRVSVIRHAVNIGLPAVSEYEGYRIARGDRIAFAFDDTVFTPDALRQLLTESDAHPDALIVGWVTAHYAENPSAPAREIPLGRGAVEHELLSANVIANSAVLAPRAVLDGVGLYDPHISLARLCDYDLWVRARRQFPVHFVDIEVGEEFGPATTDSLGATYPLDLWTADDRMRQDRTAMLRPEEFGEIDVVDSVRFASPRSRETIDALVMSHRATRPWLPVPERTALPSMPAARVLVLAHPIDGSTQLVFEAMRDDPRVHVRIIDPNQRAIAELIEADVVITSRQVRGTSDWTDAARAMGIPVYFYLDDNVPLMRATGELGEAWDEYEPNSLRAAIADFDGMLASTVALAESFREQALHPRVASLPIAAPRSVIELRPRREPRPTEHPEPIVVGLFIGAHRIEAFGRVTLPALRLVAQELGVPIRVLIPETFAREIADQQQAGAVELETFAPSRDWFAALRTLRDAHVDVLAVPDSLTINSPFKTLHPLLSAALLGAELVVPDQAPYTEAEGTPGLTLVTGDGSIESWARALRSAVKAKLGEGRSGVPASVLDERFDSASAVTSLLQAVGPLPTVIDRGNKLQALIEWHARELALTRVQVDLYQRLPQRLLDPEDAFGTLMTELHGALRTSRRYSAFRRRGGPLQRFPAGTQPGERAEISAPLVPNSYRSYRITIERGRFRELALPVWSSGLPGDLIGVEIVDPHGVIVLHTVAALPRDDGVVRVMFDASGLQVPDTAEYEARVFTQTNQPAFVLEAVHRGRWGLRRPVARPLIEWVRE